ncbi:MAG: hypothetical protein E7612_06840 [Ruminococcaceae bacterium]|nr:hypothetical protein [Oscillospiraceae bacterium]
MGKKNLDLNSKITDYGTARIDPFYYEQPPLEFVDELKKPYHEKKPDGFACRLQCAGEVDADGIFIDCGDFAESELLATAFTDFKKFTQIFEISGDRYPIILKKIDTDTYESFEIEIRESEAVIKSGDTEGVRRAIVYIEDEMRKRGGAFLPKGKIKKKPWIKSRITRGFFSPTNRAPKFGDELFDDIDYYPDEYLNRLAHDGTNGIWIYTSFRALMPSNIFSEYGEGGEKRIEKLRAVVKKCALYGIKVYVFAIEPMHLVGEMAEKYEDATGAFNSEFGMHAICTSTEQGKRYLLESVENLFRLVPDLGGYIDITSGERITNCASFPNIFHTCKRCSKRPIGHVLAETANIIKEGMRRAGTGAEFISWTYGHKMWRDEDILDYVRKCDTDIALMQNFEEYTYTEQLGKLRQGKDYWLSAVGPGELFKLTANEAKKLGKPIYAKMQICCSHEVASVPYIPTPGLIFEKYKAAREYGTSGVMQCWYFGNYPSVMSKAAGELSFCDDFTDKEDFLLRLAAIHYGEAAAKNVALAWKLFEEGYSNYPLNIMFSYYGPMHDSVVWQLHLKPKDNYLSRSWQLLDKPDGDRIHEALWQGHSLEDALTLCEIMSAKWNEGVKQLPFSKDDEAYTVSAALGLLFESGKNILKFYKLRRELGIGTSDPLTVLSDMRQTVLDEIQNSRDMIPLCEKDKRLGYHSEAEGFKFFPKKLKERICQLEELLNTEFVEVEERVKKGKTALEFYDGLQNGENCPHAYSMNSSEIREFGEARHSFKIGYDKEAITLVIDAKTEEKCVVCYEFEPLIPSPAITLGADGKIDFVSEVYTHHSMFGDKFDKERKKYELKAEKTDTGVRYTLKAKRDLTGWTADKPLRLRLSVGGDFVKPSKIKLRFLAKWDEYPDMFIWLMP